MATTYKILGQSRPTGTAVTDVYTVPASTQAVVSTITATNVDGVASNIRIYAVGSGSTASQDNALVYNAELAATQVQAFSLGLTLSAGAKIAVQSATGSAVAYQVFGSELT